MGSYYYLLAQLPYPVFGQKPPMSSVEFKELAMPLMEGKDALLLAAISIDSHPVETNTSSGCEFIDSWREWEMSLRLNLAKLRSVKIKREGFSVEPPGFPLEMVTAAAKAMQENPLEAEILIDKARWSAIDSIQGNDYFDRNSVFAYLLKLMILERQASFQAETGFSEYESLYASILEQSGTLTAGDFK